MITRVRQLTYMNIEALRAVLPEVTTGATYAEFASTPAQALATVERVMSELAGTSTTYRSLSAVRRKLRNAAPYRPQEGVTGTTKLTDYVTIIR